YDAGATDADANSRADAARSDGGRNTTGGSGTTGDTRDGGSSSGVTSGGPTGGDGGAMKKFAGKLTTKGQVRSDFSMYWDQISPENEGKWGSVEGTRNQMNWGALDRIHDYCKQNNIIFKQHNFVWGSQQPGWLNGLSADQQKAEVEEWIKLFC